MTQETLRKANQITDNIRDLERIVSEFKEGASLRVEGVAYGHPITSEFVQREVSKSIIVGLEAKIHDLKEEFKNL